MSLAWKVTVTVVLFARRRGRSRRPHRQPARHAAHGRLLRRRRPGQPVNVTLQTVGTYGSGTHPTWVSYLVQSPAGPVGPHDDLPGARAHPDQRDDLPVRLGQPAAQPADRPGDRDVRQRGHSSTASRSGSSTPTPATASRTPSPSRRSASTCRCTATTATPTSAARRRAPRARRTT